MSNSERTTRREALKKASFVAPIILTFPAVASFARAGSRPYRQGDQGDDNNNQ